MYLIRGIAAQDIKYEDDFNRADGNIGNGWLLQGTATPTIVSNKCGLSNANTNTLSHALWPAPLNTDEQIIEITIGDYAAVYASAAIMGGSLRANAEQTQSVAFLLIKSAYDNPTVAIYNPTAYNVFGTAKATSAAFAVASGDIISLRTTGNLYQAYHNATLRTSWTDSGLLCPIGSLNRNVSAFWQAQGSLYGTTTTRMDKWTGKDSLAA